MQKTAYLSCLLLVLGTAAVSAADLEISLGIRETGGSGPVGANGGASGGIEWVNLDGQTLTLDGTWQQFTFTPNADVLTPFAGATADGILDVDWATLEHIRIKNTVDGATAFRLYVDDIVNTDASGAQSVTDFEGFAVGDEVVFQEPSFSGSTDGNLNADTFDSAVVSDAMALGGSQSNQVEFEYVDDDASRWLRFTTFNTPNLPNPLLHVREPGAPNPTVSFWMKGEVIPEPSSLALVGMGLLGMLGVGRRVF